MIISRSARQLTAGQLTGKETRHLVSHQDYQLHHLMQPDFAALQQTAQQAGFNLQLASAFRPFERQLLIWNHKFNGIRPLLDSQSQPLDTSELGELDKIVAIMRWSALPGASRHHWGTDVDVYAMNCLPTDTKLQLAPWEYQTGGHQAEFFQWLKENMAAYGFYLPYAEDRGGVALEPWHISYHAVSQGLLAQLTPELLYHALNHSHIAGKSQILANLDNLYTRFIENVCEI